MSNVADEIRSYIESDVVEPGVSATITNDTALWDEELIDSMGIMMLIAHIESEYEVDIDADDVDVENFKSVARIAALIADKQG